MCYVNARQKFGCIKIHPGGPYPPESADSIWNYNLSYMFTLILVSEFLQVTENCDLA